ncbi:nucleotidyltransferase-like protein [Dysgonomonas alginatilytica]|uniref:Nucleotidyltransferase-like protein n=1 Tax=Dysgonomonas alginatilytica TaxID=1605892 RepID=A0A2V3PL20_9BACT|nr:nucleotidyltransferase domain-containing protein [Dysgonomonas alginatilytica]PXV62473.1 nucleotidyltransferase-like protein [Dysgonomonas alginatilytica]
MHLKIATELMECLHNSFPDASIALSGSVAHGTFKKESDIDILFSSKTIHNSYNIGYIYKGIRISIFIFQRQFLQQNDSVFLHNYDVVPISIIYRSEIIYDPSNLILDLKERIINLLMRRGISRKSLIRDLKGEIYRLLEVNASDTIERKEILYRTIKLITTMFFLKECADKINTKEIDSNPFPFIRSKDPKLCDILESCVPFHDEANDVIKDAFYSYISFKY